MKTLLDLYAAGTLTGVPNTDGVDKTPIDATMFPFPGSKDLAKSDLSKARHGALGSGLGAEHGGFDNIKTYESQVTKK